MMVILLFSLWKCNFNNFGLQNPNHTESLSFAGGLFIWLFRKNFPPCWTFLEANRGTEPLCQQYV